MTNLPQTTSISTIRDLLMKSKPQLAMAVPKHLDPDRLLRIAMTSIQKVPRLLECDTKSLLGSVMEAAQLGLVLDGVLGYAYLVPYRTKRGTIAQMQVGYRGFIDLAYRSGRVSTLYAQNIREGDKYDYAEGLDRVLVHTPARDNDGPIIATYAVVKYKDGASDFEFMWKADIDKIRNSSKASDDGPWVTHYPEMAKKTAIRKLAKRLPLSTDFQRAAVLDDYADNGVLDAEVVDPAAGDLEQRIQDAAQEKTPSLVKCPHCDFMARSEQGLKSHITRSHPDLKESEGDGGIPRPPDGSTDNGVELRDALLDRIETLGSRHPDLAGEIFGASDLDSLSVQELNYKLNEMVKRIE